MKSKYKQSFCYGEKGISFFFRICFLLILIPKFCLSQIYVSESTIVYDPDNAIETDYNSQKAKADLYIVKGTVTSGLENQSVVVAYIDGQKPQKVKSLLAEKKIYDSKNTKKTVSGRKETPKQQSLVYKPLNNQNSFSFSNGNANSVVSSAPNFSAKKDGIITKFEIEISSVLSHKNQKTFSPENENSIKLPTSHTVRPPPTFCIC